MNVFSISLMHILKIIQICPYLVECNVVEEGYLMKRIFEKMTSLFHMFQDVWRVQKEMV